MGYETPNVVKEIYLPLDYNFIYEHDQITFKNFSELYKKEYGIDLHDVFELKHDLERNEYYVRLKTPLKLFTYGIGNVYVNMQNLVAFGIHNTVTASIPETGTTELMNVGCGIMGAAGYGIKICLGTTAPTSIDDLLIESFEY